MAVNATHTHHSSLHHAKHASHTNEGILGGPYSHFLILMGVHFVIMFAVMYTMVDGFSDIYLHLNQVYMTGMMVAPMAILMVLHMKKMYPDKTKNIAIYLGSILIFFGFYAFMRGQTFIGDKQLVRSMIPHHSGAVLMCDEAKLSDPELKSLCAKIVDGQKAEIAQMKGILSRLN